MVNMQLQEGKKKAGKWNLRFVRMQAVAAAFLIILAVLVLNKRNVTYEVAARKPKLIAETETLSAEVFGGTECLILWEEEDLAGEKGLGEMEAILSQMRIGYETCECGEFRPERLLDVKNVVVSVSHLDRLGEGLLDLMDWVREGGNLMVLYMPDNDGMLQFIAGDLGIGLTGGNRVMVEELRISERFLIGGARETFQVTDPYDSSVEVVTKPECQIYMESGGEDPTPIVWRYSLGEGTAVTVNLGFLDKTYRGIYSAAYALLGDLCAWPVINSSAFYIDDFPSPVPAGEGKYITRDYGMDIKTFYTMVWWENVKELAEKHGVAYTGLVIEEYSDQVEGPFARNEDIARYQYFGNTLLAMGGEIGFHGYNHMPLCLKNFDFQGQYESYKRWESYGDMRASLEELNAFCEELFPEESFVVYVPPSNILSEEGRSMIAKDFPEIKAIASVYLPGGVAYEQEFEVAEDGIVETPRVISGYIMDDYTKLAALSELNFHFVSSHFQHPDDVLDEDRGAALGWPQMYENISDYMDWLYSSAPEIRRLTGVEMAGAVQRYDALSISREVTEDSLKLSIGGFYDEAWFLVRINEGEPGAVTGGTLTEQIDGLYLLQADKPEVIIELE